MAQRTITITHEGVDYAASVMTVESTFLGYEDHGLWSAYLRCGAESTGVSIGGYCLDEPVERDGKTHREGSAFGLDHIMRICETVGVNAWEDLRGKHLLVLHEGKNIYGRAVGIASLVGDRVLIFEDHARQWRATHEQVSA